MGLHTKFISFLFVSSFSITIFEAADDTKLIFKGCANQKFQDPSGTLSRNLKTLMSNLVSQSSQKTFSTTTYGEYPYAITGLYQCRGDLTTSQCNNCVSKIMETSYKLCGDVVAARFQLSGCYLRYEIVGFKQVSGTELLFKTCGRSVKTSGTEFETRRDSAFNMVVNGLKSGLFYTGNYESVYVLGQCEGDLSTNDCGDCVKSGLGVAKNDCGDSISGQVYLHKCYISYSYYSNGVPTISSPSGTGTGQGTQRTVAIVVGGVAALAFIVVCLMFLKSVFKKRRSKY